MNKFSNPKFLKKIIYLLLFFCAALSTAAYTGFNRSLKHVDEFPYIDISRDLIGQEHFISNFKPLRDEFSKIISKYPKKEITLYFEFLNTGANINIKPELRVWPASLAKIPIALAAMKKVEEGEWELDSELVLFNQDKNDRFGPLANEATGTRYTIEKLVFEMLSNSDNMAYNMLKRNLTDEEQAELIEATGLEELFSPAGQITAKEYSRFFRILYTASYLKRENSQRILEWLDQSPHDDFLESGIPAGLMFPHKIGENQRFNLLSDSGIVYVPNRPYLLTVMIAGKDTGTEADRNEAKMIFREISKAAYDYVVNQ